MISLAAFLSKICYKHYFIQNYSGDRLFIQRNFFLVFLDWWIQNTHSYFSVYSWWNKCMKVPFFISASLCSAVDLMKEKPHVDAKHQKYILL